VLSIASGLDGHVEAMSLTNGVRLGGYQIIAPLGTGGMGEVYRARDTGLKRESRLKYCPTCSPATVPMRSCNAESEYMESEYVGGEAKCWYSIVAEPEPVIIREPTRGS
jgi:serine/threonine protein kinase